MLTESGCAARQSRLWDRVPERFEWLLIADPRHVYYLSNFWVNPLSFSAGERGLLLLERSGDVTLVADNFTRRSAAGQPYVDREIIQPWYDHKHSVINRDLALLNGVQGLAESLFGRVGAVEAEWMPLAAWEVMALDHEVHTLRQRKPGQSRHGEDATDTVDLGCLLRDLRRNKLPDEIELLKTCMKAGKAGLDRARSVIRPGITDWEVYREMHAAVLEAAGRPAQIYGDFRATNASTPKAGGPPVGHTLQARDLLILDYSVVLDGYRSDFTNTLAVGEPSEQQQILFSLCTAAMGQGELELSAGTAAKNVHSACMKVFHDAGYGEFSRTMRDTDWVWRIQNRRFSCPKVTTFCRPVTSSLSNQGSTFRGRGGIRIEHNYQITESGSIRLSQHEIAL